MSSTISLIGFDLKYPIVISEQGTPELVGNTELLRQSLKDRLLTPIGSRYFNRSYGCRLPLLINEPNAPIAIPVAKEYIIEAVRQEQRVIFQDAILSQDLNSGVLRVSVICRQRETNEIVSVNLEYSFLNI